jgi:hypothetical protein
MESENEILGTPKPRIYIVVLLYKSLSNQSGWGKVIKESLMNIIKTL